MAIISNEDIHGFRARQMRENFAGKVIPSDAKLVKDALEKLGGYAKREDIITQLATEAETSLEAAKELVTSGLSDLEKNGQVEHPSHGYWKLV